MLRPEVGARGTARDRILDATLRVISEGGIDAVTHRAVAARAGVSPGSTTHHFTSREAMLRAAFRHHLGRLEELIRSPGQPAPAGEIDPSGRIQEVLRGLIESEFTEHSLVRAEYELLLFASTDSELAADVRAWEERMVGLLASTLEEAGAPRPVEAARTLVNLLRGYELERLVNPRLTTEDFSARLAPVLRALCSSARGGQGNRGEDEQALSPGRR